MKKLILTTITAMTFTTVAQADVIQCDFTEPFITFKYDTTTAQMESLNPDETMIHNNVELEIVGPNEMNLVWVNESERRNVVQMKIDYKGSNGMSDHIYPYSALYYANDSVTTPLYGGCHSKNLKTILPDGGAH